MKPHRLLIGCLAALTVLLVVVTTVIAQTTTSSSSTTLKQAVALIGQGDLPAARQTLATITNAADANYGQARCYDALCLYKLGDKRAFLKAMNSPAVQAAPIADAIRQDLEVNQMDALFYYRNFDELAAKLQGFQTNHPASSRLPVVAEYQMAGLFEYGMKQTYEACSLKDTNQFIQHWNVGRDRLQKFVAAASQFSGTNYLALTNRVLREEIWTARMTLGQEAQLLSEIPAQDTNALERVGLLGIRLYQKLQPAAVGDNLQRMQRFIRQFPQSKNRKRVEFAMANISFSKGEALTRAADAADQSGDADTAARDRAQASRYFDYTRTLQNDFVVDPAAGIEAQDVFDRQDDLLNSYYLEKNYDRLLALANEMEQEATPGGLQWLMGKNYSAIAQTSQSAPDLKLAATTLDEVLAVGFNGRADHDHQVLMAAKWRIYLAHRSGDAAKVTQLIQWVQDSTCVKNQKQDFLKIYSGLLNSPKTAK